MARLREEASLEQDTIIALTELLAYVLLAARQGGKWQHRYVFYVTDNLVVRAWLTTRRAREPSARVLLRVLIRVELKERFTTVSYYVRAYHHDLCDRLTRESAAVVQAGMEAAGFEVLDPPQPWASMVEAVTQ
eukprot:2393806-Lingulodinium_polyedra.AAC.1